MKLERAETPQHEFEASDCFFFCQVFLLVGLLRVTLLNASRLHHVVSRLKIIRPPKFSSMKALHIDQDARNQNDFQLKSEKADDLLKKRTNHHEKGHQNTTIQGFGLSWM